MSLLKEAEDQFQRLSQNRTAIDQALKNLDIWIAAPMFAAQRDAILDHAAQGQFALLLDSFYQLLPFGTGGRRGRVGYGSNRINPVTVAMSVQGHCNFLRERYGASSEKFHGGTVAVAFDTRIFSDIAQTYAFLSRPSLLLGLTSRDLARIACEIYASNGFEVRVAGLNSDTEYVSTPELSFSVRRLKALGGMNVSASHNHPDDNGFKFFNQYGAQDIPPADQEMASYMGDVREIGRMPFPEAIEQGRIRPFPAELHEAYVDANLALRHTLEPRARGRESNRRLTVVYTPLCGTGDRSTGDVLRAGGVDVRLYPPHSDFDGTFRAIPFRLPNPEVPEAASPALKFADELNVDLILSTDPDADRLGVFARGSDGMWRYLNGNEIASVLAYYLALDVEFGPRRRGFFIKTLVTTRMLERIAERAGCPIVGDLMVGFKYVAHVLLSLEREGKYGNVQARAGDLVLAGEESHGVLLTPEIRDKDAAGGALVLCELLAQLRAREKYLPEYLDRVAAECGNFQNAARSIVMRGIRGSELLERMMRSLRENPPRALAEMPVVERRDFLSPEHGPLRSDTERLSRNLLAYRLEKAEVKAQIVVRPSGTEPKAKIYVDLEGSAMERTQARRSAEELAARTLEECVARIGFHLSPCAGLLPDTVDLDLKDRFGTAFREELAITANDLSRATVEERLAWLRRRLAPYGAGADPLDATSAATAALLHEVAAEVPTPAREALIELESAVKRVPAPVEWIR
ncbi:MAG TPA: hypothetical protein VIY49_17470 [Bryobacteraceae bacterium]